MPLTRPTSKRKFKSAYAPVDPRVEFSEEDWDRVESAGGRSLSKEHRKAIKRCCRCFVQSCSADKNAVDETRIKKRIQHVVKHATALRQSLEIRSRFTTIDDWVAWNINCQLMGEEIRRQTVPPVWHLCNDVIVASEAALASLLCPEKMTVSQPGPPHALSKEQFFQELALVFKDAGGKTAISVGSSKKNGSERVSHFVEFVHAIYSVLSRAKENELQTTQKDTIAFAMKRALGARAN